MAVSSILYARILRQSEASDDGLLVWACDFARTCRDREGDLAAMSVLAQHEMAALAAIDKTTIDGSSSCIRLMKSRSLIGLAIQTH